MDMGPGRSGGSSVITSSVLGSRFSIPGDWANAGAVTSSLQTSVEKAFKADLLFADSASAQPCSIRFWGVLHTSSVCGARPIAGGGRRQKRPGVPILHSMDDGSAIHLSPLHELIARPETARKGRGAPPPAPGGGRGGVRRTPPA